MSRVDDVDLRTLEAVKPTEATAAMTTSAVRMIGAVCAVCGKTLPLSAAEWNQTRVVAGKRVHGGCAPPWAKYAPDANIDASAAPPTLIVEVTHCEITVMRDDVGMHTAEVVTVKATGGAAKDLDDAFQSRRRVLFKFTKGGSVVIAIDGVITDLNTTHGFERVVEAKIRGRGLG